MTNHAWMTIEGKSQGLIYEGCSTLESIGNITSSVKYIVTLKFIIMQSTGERYTFL